MAAKTLLCLTDPESGKPILLQVGDLCFGPFVYSSEHTAPDPKAVEKQLGDKTGVCLRPVTLSTLESSIRVRFKKADYKPDAIGVNLPAPFKLECCMPLTAKGHEWVQLFSDDITEARMVSESVLIHTAIEYLRVVVGSTWLH